MDYRPPLGAQRPAPPQRAVSGGSYGGHPGPPLPPRLSNVRSVSQPVNIVDLTAERGSGRVLAAGGNEAMVTSPEVTDREEEDAEPPAKRAKTVGGEFQAAGEDGQANAVNVADEVLPGTPLPTLPRARPSAGRVGAYRRSRFGIEPSARKAHGLEPPAVATRVPPPKKALDFAPWSGNHQEDVLNENTIKGGSYDKVASTNQTETNSAKPSLWPSLSQKNHAGLSALSYMYVAVLEKRQTLGKCTAPSTFKPPPRLAVQEAKRAKWLEDLADPTVSLRRLSKTIPHGIKGKLLMEQCLNKYIPFHRAMWLVRGVGMHELRAFRRKGFNEAQAASGEVKWVREWTINVTQFLEDVMAACGQPDWQKKMNYAVKLATALYSENLLDVDYHLDWIVKSLAECTTERLPIWIIIAQIHWKDLIMFGRRGRKLTEGILMHLHTLTEAGTPGSALLQTKLQKMVTVLAVTNRGCLILPRIWQKYRGLLTPSTSSPATSPASNIARRNERLAAPLLQTPENTRSAYLDLYDLLDSIGLDFDIKILTDRCVWLIPDTAKLVPALLDWASTRYRTGISRIYLAAGLLARLHETGHDIDSIVLQYLGGSKDVEQRAEDHIHRVIVELARLQAFSIGRYLQWLIASGALYNEARTTANSLIAALPVTGLPKHVLNTRNMLMGRLGYAIDEGQALHASLDYVDQLLAGGQDHSVLPTEFSRGLSKSAAYGLAQQISEKTSLTVKEAGLGLEQFCVLRDHTEQIGDISSLANLVAAATTSDIGALLATAADTVNYHATTFAALGQLTALVDRLSEQYLALRPHQPLDRSFIIALSGLARRIPGKTSLVKLFADDLILCEQQTSLAACSPASDSVIDMHATKLDSDEDIDAVFASGNVMDEQLMQRVFSRLNQRASRPASAGGLTRVVGWLDQLRSVDASRVLDGIVDKYLRSMVNGGSGNATRSAVIAGMTLSGCASLSGVAELAKDIRDAETAAQFLPVFLSPADGLGLEPVENYRFRLQQQQCQVEHADDVIRLLQTSLSSSSVVFDERREDCVHFVVQSATTHKQAIGELFAGAIANETSRKNAGHLLNAILGCTSRDEINVSSVVAGATSLSVRFSLAVQHLKAPDSGEPSALRDAIMGAFERCSEVWPQLLSVADEETTRALRENAHGVLLQLAEDGDHESRQDEVERTLDLLAVTSNVSHKQDVPFIAVVVERLKELERQLADSSEQSRPHSGMKDGLFRKLDLLLRLATPNIYAAESELDTVQQTRANLLHALCALLVHRELQLRRQVIEHIFDLASTLSDNLPESILASVKNRLPPDARLNSILGTSFNTTEAWLALATQVQPAGGATQQQRALSKHAAQHQPQLQPQQKSAAPRSATQGGPSTPAQRGWPGPTGSNKMPAEVKMTPFQLRQWEIISDPASSVGENDTALSLGLFGMRKV